MARDLPPTAEGALLRKARQRIRPRLSIEAAAARASMSAENWGHVERGYQSMGRGQEPRIVIPPGPTLAHMARVVGLTPRDLAEIGRGDAADILADLITPTEAHPAAGPVSLRAGASAATIVTEAPAARRLPRWFISELERRGLPAETLVRSVETLQGLAGHFGYSLAELLLQAGLAPASELRMSERPSRQSHGESKALAEFDEAIERILSNPLLSRRQRKAAETFAAQARREVLESPEGR